MKRFSFLIVLTLFTAFVLASCAKEKSEPQAAQDDATSTALITLDVEGMTCAGCETNVKTALKKVAGVKSVEASYKAGEAKVQVNPELVKEDEIESRSNGLRWNAA